MGQANYSAAKSKSADPDVSAGKELTGAVGLVGFTRTLAREGAKHNIKVNVIVPVSYVTDRVVQEVKLIN